jgi:hypothetical protein
MVSLNLSFLGFRQGAARDKALTRAPAKAGSRLMPDSHNAVEQTDELRNLRLTDF